MAITWIESGSWYIAPEGYAIDEVKNSQGILASSFIQEAAYTPDDRVIGFRWKFNNGEVRDALVPVEGYYYIWYPYGGEGWHAVGDKLGTAAERYTDSGEDVGTVWVYAPVHAQTEPPTDLNASFAGFTLNKINGGQTTTRQSTGETAKDFQFYPLINVAPDMNGDFTVVWSYSNNFDGIPYDSGPITNVFAGLTGGQATQLQLTDNRPGIPGGGPGLRDTNRGGAIAIGDWDFKGLGKQDGNWYSFASAVTAKVTSPSGANKTVNGNLQDNFKSVGGAPPPGNLAVIVLSALVGVGTVAIGMLLR